MVKQFGHGKNKAKVQDLCLRVGLLAPSGGQHVAAQWGIWMAGAVAGNNPSSSKSPRTQDILEDLSHLVQFPSVPPTRLPA